MSRRVTALLLFALAAALLGPASGEGANGTARDTTPFKVMGMTGINVTTSNYPELIEGMQAAAAAVNKAGGLGGRQVQIVACNMQGTTAGAAACAQQAADQHLDWVYSFEPNETSAYPILDNAGIPYAGSKLYTAIEARNPNLYPQLGPVQVGVAAACTASVQSLQKSGTKHPRFAFMVLDNAAATGSLNLCKQAVIKAGGQWVGVVPVAVGSVDYSTPTLALKQMNPDIVGNAVSADVQVGVWKTAAQFGLNPVWACSGSVATIGVIQSANVPNLNIWLGNPTPLDDLPNYPGTKQFRADIAASGTTDVQALDNVSAQGWVFIQGLKKLASITGGSITSQTLIAKLKTIRNLTIIPGVSWMPTVRGPAVYKNDPNGNTWVSRWNGTTFVPVNTKPLDEYAALGIGKTPTFAQDVYP